MATDPERISKLEGDMVEVKTRLAIAENNITSINTKLDKIDSNTTWTIRLVLGAVILAIVNVVLNGGFG